jgi:adenine deaminase
VNIAGRLVDLHARRIIAASVEIDGERIVSITEIPDDASLPYILPGFVDAHVHIESSMLVPSEFARLAVVHGTVATVSDPHEIGNVCGVEGVRYMIDNGALVPFTFAFGAPSCVPATAFETAGARISADDIRALFADERVRYLSEMMNWPGVLHDDPEVIEKIRIAHACGRTVDGHAPGLRGDAARLYAAHGIHTDHECFTLDEALDKINAGMKILIREGSAARNFDALHPLLSTHPDVCMFCSDDMHPDSLVVGHIDLLVRRAVALGYDVFDVLRAACIHPVEHYGLPVGQLRVGDPADLILVTDLVEFSVQETWIRGECVARNGSSFIEHVEAPVINAFTATPIVAADLTLSAASETIRVIEAQDGQLVTNSVERRATIVDGSYVADPTRDLLKLVVVNRYTSAPPAIAFITGMGLQQGAIASTVAHDSHNVIAVGSDDVSIAAAINAVIAERGGVAVADADGVHTLPLPVAGLMSTNDGYQVAERYAALDVRAKACGSHLRAPFMTLSFMALLVIPALKLSDKGLFDGTTFTFTTVSV